MLIITMMTFHPLTVYMLSFTAGQLSGDSILMQYNLRVLKTLCHTDSIHYRNIHELPKITCTLLVTSSKCECKYLLDQLFIITM